MILPLLLDLSPPCGGIDFQVGLGKLHGRIPSNLGGMSRVATDDILIYSSSLEEHAKHLRKVFQRLKENKLYAKLEKCEFGVTEVDLLGHRITQEGLMMDDHKVKAFLDWGPPRSVPALKSFLGLASYYRKFIKNFAKIATPLTNLLTRSQVTGVKPT